LNDNDDDNNNKQVCIAPLGRNFRLRGAGLEATITVSGSEFQVSQIRFEKR